MSNRFYISQYAINSINSLLTSSTGLIQFDITRFKLSSGHGYTPVVNENSLTTQTEPQGTTVYEAVPTSFAMYSDSVVDIVCSVPMAVGPFDFGEVSLYCLDRFGQEIMLGIFVYPALQRKTTQITDGVTTEWNFHCLLELGTAAQVIFNAMSNSNSLIPSVPDFSYVTGPTALANPTNALIVHDTLATNASQLLISSGTQPKWNIVDWYQLAVVTNSVGSQDPSIPPSTVWGSIVQIDNAFAKTATTVTHEWFKTLDDTVNKGYLLQDNNGNIVPVTGIDKSTGVATLVRPSAWVLNAIWFSVHEFDSRYINTALTAFGTDLLQKVQSNYTSYSGLAGGTANAITCVLPDTGLTFSDGFPFTFVSKFANTTATPTLQLTLGTRIVKTPTVIVKEGGLPLVAGDIPQGNAVTVVWSAAQGKWILVNPAYQLQITSLSDALTNNLNTAIADLSKLLSQRVQSDYYNFAGTATGTIDAIACVIPDVDTAFGDGFPLRFVSKGANATTTPTLSLSTGSDVVKTPTVIVKEGGMELVIGDIPAANAMVYVTWSAALGKWVLMNPAYQTKINALSTAIGNINTALGASVPAINPVNPKDGDIKVVGSTIYIHAQGWRQIFPALYS